MKAFGYNLDDMQWFTVNAMKSAFIPFDARRALIDDVITSGYTTLKVEAGVLSPEPTGLRAGWQSLPPQTR